MVTKTTSATGASSTAHGPSRRRSTTTPYDREQHEHVVDATPRLLDPQVAALEERLLSRLFWRGR